jgi:hypothetical protein
MMIEALLVVKSLFNLLSDRRAEKIPEPEFQPFRFPRHEAQAATVRALAPVATARPQTLQELGMDGGLARDIEGAFQLLGATVGEKVVGFSFRTPDGVTHALRTAATPAQPARRAA